MLLKTEAGSVLMTGDYKFDQTPVDGRPADVSRLAELGKEGLTLLCGDSTNADRPGVAPSESAVGPALLEQFSRCKGRIIVTSFASNIHRVQQVIDAAARLDRKVALVGRSMRKNFNIASNLGIASAPQGIFIQPREIEDFPDEKVVVDLHRQPGRAALGAAADGQQRPPRRAVALRRHRRLLGDAGPRQRAGGERDDRPHLRDRRHRDHRQGRPDPRLRPWLAGGAEADAEPDQAALRDAGPRRPQAAAPARGAGRIGRNRQRQHLPGPQRAAAGSRLATAPASARTSTPGVIYVDGVNIGEPDDAALRDRREISADGIFIVVATISSDDGKVVADPEVIFRGVAFLEEADALVEDLKDLVEDQLEDAAYAGRRETHLIEEDLHDGIGKFVWQRLRRRPMVLPVVVEV